MMTAEKVEAIKRFKELLETHSTITISTCSPEGELWSTKTYYGDENGYIYVCIEDKGKAFANIKKNPRIFFVIEKNDPFFFAQGTATVEIIGPSEEHPLERSYYLRKNFGAVGFLRMVKTHVIRIKPEKVFISDFREGWKPRTELTFDDESFSYLQSLYEKKPTWKYYLQATRPWVIGITISAVFIGTLMAIKENTPHISIANFLLALMGAVFVHLGVNAWSDYFDYKKGADKWFTLGSSRTIVDYLLKPHQVLLIGIVLLICAVICAIILYFKLGQPTLFLYLIGTGAILGLFYAFIPVGWKYVALGDLAVFAAWSLICMGTYYIHTGNLSLNPFIAFLPVAILVVGILHGNNMRDIKDDLSAGYRTLATILGLHGSQIYYMILIAASYISLIIATYQGILPVWALAGILTAHIAWKQIKWSRNPGYLQFNMLDYYTARLANKIAICIIVGIVIHLLAGK